MPEEKPKVEEPPTPPPKEPLNQEQIINKLALGFAAKIQEEMNTKINKVAELMQSNHDLRDEIERMLKDKEDMETRMFNLTIENENLAAKVDEYEGMIFKATASPSNSPKKGVSMALNSLTVDSSPMRGRRSTNKPNVKSDFFSSEDSNNDNEEMARIKKAYMEKKA